MPLLIIKVFLKKEGENCLIGIADNGVGLPEDFNSSEIKSMGMDLIHILADQLDAKLIIESSKCASFTLETSKSKLFV